MHNYGNYLKEHRLANNQKLKNVSDGTGISIQNISRWERGEVLPNIDFCVKLADYYGVSLDELFGRDENFNNKN